MSNATQAEIERRESRTADRLWERLLPVLDGAVGNGQLTRDEAFAVLDSLGKPRESA